MLLYLGEGLMGEGGGVRRGGNNVQLMLHTSLMLRYLKVHLHLHALLMPCYL